MAEDKRQQPEDKTQRNDLQEEYRSLSTDIAALAMPVAVVTAPVVNAWAKQHYSQDEKSKDSAPPQQQAKDD
jgi:hypothetical protein